MAGLRGSVHIAGGEARLAHTGGAQDEARGPGDEPAAGHLVQGVDAARVGRPGPIALLLGEAAAARQRQPRVDAQAAADDLEVVVPAAERAGADLLHPQPVADATEVLGEVLEGDGAVGDHLGGAVLLGGVHEERGDAPFAEHLDQRGELVLEAPGRRGQDLHEGERVEDEAIGPDLRDHVPDAVGDVDQLHLVGYEDVLARVVASQHLARRDGVHVDAVERPPVRRSDPLEHAGRLRQADEEAGLAAFDAGPQVLQA